ncbi:MULTISPECIES: ATP-binding cassette domain-containing protein [Arthrobacter]|uniref:ATP-binding cassette domain-containing protein n=2 Tax=Arthrobacter TaxID=1663 RepID=A0ABU9KLQ2_9MICC|nr:ATP-binding cassette domain-containing protein [Arthrobacter sp. YJM1]MDP5228456.1 ATP-binding cassette domain-containing protein [Arthrobacter sp. YJM1]
MRDDGGAAMNDGAGLLVRASVVGVQIGERWLVRPASFQVGAGGAMALTGPNGSGKTTLLRVVLGRQVHSTGTLQRGAELDGGAHGVAAMTGPPPFYARLTVEEHLEAVEASWENTGGLALPFQDILDVLDLHRLMDQFPDELSSGERQGIGLAMALARPAALLLLDEPEQRLDTRRREAVAELIRHRLEQGTGVLMATHDSHLPALLGADVLRLRRQDEQDGPEGDGS